MPVIAGSPELRVLVVDDDTELCQLLSEYLATEGYAVEAVHTGRLGVERALEGDHAIVVLDVMLPDLKGFEVLRRVRAQSRRPILMLTARGDEQDRILGLEMGADDYLPKPFNPRELSARIDAVLRRSRPQTAGAARRRPAVGRRRVGRQGLARRAARRPGARPDDGRIRSARPAAARRRARDSARRAGAERPPPRVLAVRPQHRHARQQPPAEAGPRRPTAPSASRACAASATSTRSTSARPRTNADAPPARQDLPVVLARRAGRQRHAGDADRVEPLARRRRPPLGGEVHAAAGHVGAAGIGDPPPRRAGRAGALRRLVRDGSRRRELHLRRRREGSAGPGAARAGARAGAVDGRLAGGHAAGESRRSGSSPSA